MEDLRVYQPRKARACNLREGGRRKVQAGGAQTLSYHGEQKREGPYKISLPFLTQIKHRKLWQPRHDPPANPNLALSVPQLYGGQVGGGRTTENRRRSGD